MTIRTISAVELHHKMDAGESLFILDVRNPEEYQDWKIEGKKLQSINIPYFDFLDDRDTLYTGVPNDTEIITVCAKGGSAQMVAELLDQRGYDVSVLEGGMLAWSQFYVPVTIVEDENLKLIQFNRLAKGCLSYMVISDGKALVVDPGRHVDEYLRVAEQDGVQIEHIMDTHLHADHITGGPELAQKTGATYYISASEMQGSDRPYEPLEKHSVIQFGHVNVKILSIPTPGHTPGSMSFLINDQFLLSGDTIFVGGLGRPDLGGKAREWAQALYDTVFRTIAQLSDDVLVLPAHYADIQEINASAYVGETLGEIRRKNEIMRIEDRETFTEKVANSVGATPPNYENIVSINRGVQSVSPEKATELEIGPNRCAIHHV
ncbi:hydroxyacylglutathione hydrolase [Alicyclobacillus hesperidum]|uniref:Hydroxyacylglutathione hydrolase n=1 Tax=Alicyclobacillus hesperidum TaxID=89784 RepID=A0AA37U8W4_9BACL|nr:MBL fold metallo-hydrolase [Alicyclobacillus hesperidum]GLV14967.1 hydroxyacylglutathione hydrolase [Alicyclobacillus hesperidum]